LLYNKSITSRQRSQMLWTFRGFVCELAVNLLCTVHLLTDLLINISTVLATHDARDDSFDVLAAFSALYVASSVAVIGLYLHTAATVCSSVTKTKLLDVISFDADRSGKSGPKVQVALLSSHTASIIYCSFLCSWCSGGD